MYKQQQQEQQALEQDAENPFLDPPFSRIKIDQIGNKSVALYYSLEGKFLEKRLVRYIYGMNDKLKRFQSNQTKIASLKELLIYYYFFGSLFLVRNLPADILIPFNQPMDGEMISERFNIV
jgi:hypothetical protein